MLDWVSGSNWSYVVVFARRDDRRVLPGRPERVDRDRRPGTLAGAGDLNVFARDPRRLRRGRSSATTSRTGSASGVGERTVKRLFRHEKAHKGFDWAEQQLEERGSYIIVIARFIPVRADRGHVHGRVHARAALAPLLPLRRRRRRRLGDVRDDARLRRRQAVRGAAVEGRAARARRRVHRGRSSIELVRHRRERRRTRPAGRDGARRRRSASEAPRHRRHRASSAPSSLRSRPGATASASRSATRRPSLALLERLRPDVVIHTAYRQDGEDARAIVVDGSENVAARRPRGRRPARPPLHRRRLRRSARAHRTSRTTCRRPAPTTAARRRMPRSASRPPIPTR